MKKNVEFVLIISVVFLVLFLFSPVILASGRYCPSGVNEIIRRMVSIAGAQNVERLVIGDLVSISGCSTGVRDRLTLGEKSVNINIAVRYNSIDNRSYA